MTAPLAALPTHVIAGSLGAGKTSLIRHLLDQRPADERWAVLVNEFGQVGLDAALLARDEAGVALAEIPGGCLCCVNGVPFQVGLARLLRRARPQRLLIEPSGLGHPVDLLRQLVQPPWRGVLSVRHPVVVLDAAALARGQDLPEASREALGMAGLLVLNKAEGLDDEARARVTSVLPARPLRWTAHGRLALADLPDDPALSGDLPGDESPGDDSTARAPGFPTFMPDAAPLPAVWRDPPQPVCQAREASEGWSIGWRWHPRVRFDRARLSAWLGTLSWRRAKLVVRDSQGWWSANALEGDTLVWRPSEWRQDSRLELIFATPRDASGLTADLGATRDGTE